MKTKFQIISFFILLIISSCSKGWLDVKPQLSLVVPSTIGDYQAILDNSSAIFNIGQPALGEIGSADFNISDEGWDALYTNQEKYAYIWDKDIYHGSQDVGDWDVSYNQIFNANVVLEGIEKVKPAISEVAQWNSIKGSGLFFRAFAFYNLLQVYAKTYDSTTANKDLGIPLRLNSDVNIKSVRATVQQSYNQVISDLKQSLTLLPVNPLYKSRPSKPAAFAMLAKTYLMMGDYSKALVYADSCLQLFSTLLDYNSLDTSASYPIPKLNNETIFYSGLTNYAIFKRPDFNVDSTLYNSYDSNDLRKIIFFRNVNGNMNYRGSYEQSGVLFGGLATDEIYLIRAECYARQGDAEKAMDDLNMLLKSRWKSGTFVPMTATTAGEALSKILLERRKELCFRGIRWSDLRRLNKDNAFAVVLKRTVKDTVYELQPNSPEYVLPIPDEVIRLSNMPQNVR